MTRKLLSLAVASAIAGAARASRRRRRSRRAPRSKRSRRSSPRSRPRSTSSRSHRRRPRRPSMRRRPPPTRPPTSSRRRSRALSFAGDLRYRNEVVRRAVRATAIATAIASARASTRTSASTTRSPASARHLDRQRRSAFGQPDADGSEFAQGLRSRRRVRRPGRRMRSWKVTAGKQRYPVERTGAPVLRRRRQSGRHRGQLHARATSSPARSTTGSPSARCRSAT